MANVTLPSTSDSRDLHPAGSRLVPGWVVTQTGVTGYVLNYWRNKGFLTVPGHETSCGTGRKFPWDRAVAQIEWLKLLHNHGKVLDFEDAKAGWELRAGGARFAIRCGRDPWIPVDCLSSAVHMLDRHMVFVARVRP